MDSNKCSKLVSTKNGCGDAVRMAGSSDALFMIASLLLLFLLQGIWGFCCWSRVDGGGGACGVNEMNLKLLLEYIDAVTGVVAAELVLDCCSGRDGGNDSVVPLLLLLPLLPRASLVLPTKIVALDSADDDEFGNMAKPDTMELLRLWYN